jgi:hypothetical protein
VGELLARGAAEAQEALRSVLMRRERWEDRMMAVIERHQVQPYAAGVSDCFTMTMECVEAVIGERPFRSVRYKTDAGAAKAMLKRGFADLGEAMASAFPEQPRGLARRGDIALIPVEKGFGVALGVVVGGGIAWRGQAITILPMSAASGFHAVG